MARICPFCQKGNKTTANFCNNCGGILDALYHPLNFLLDRRYRIIEHLKKGGMANVYKAEDQRLGNKLCAIKEMLEPHDNEEMQKQFSEWFQREMQILSRLDHEAIPSVHDYFTASGRYYLVMEYMPGKNLEEMVRDEAPYGFPEDRVHDWALELAAILDYLHSQNPPVIHRDIKPSNIILRDGGQLTLVDFGIARFFSPVSTGTRIGTLGFIAPEHYRGSPEPRSDLFSLGVTLYQLLTGIDPQREAPYSLLPLAKAKPSLSGTTVSMVTRLMALNAEERFNSASHLMQYLRGEKPPRRTLSLQLHPGARSAVKEDIKALAMEPLAQKSSPREFFCAAPTIDCRDSEIISLKDGSPMVLVSGGLFVMGADDEDEEAYYSEKPVCFRDVPSFYMDRFPVTQKQFLFFLQETGYPFRRKDMLSLVYDDHPMVGVTWFDAVAYAQWAGKRLPLESEWEKAARGVDNRKYPWGNIWDRWIVNCAQRGARSTTPVGSFPDAISPFGCLDMLGNVWEWTLDNYSNYPYEGPSHKTAELITIRGGCWKSPKRECRCTARERLLPSALNSSTGFRCALSVK